MIMIKYIIASNNKGKVAELDRILNPLGITAVTAMSEGIDLGEVEETGETFAENAYIKAISAFEKSGNPCVADDSGLMVDALNGEPGVYSARYAGENATDADKVKKLLEKMKDIPLENRTARFISSICCIIDKDTVITAEETCEGVIGFEPKGDGGFGYDPVFIYNGGKTFAQLTAEEKDAVSHRGKALRSLSKKLTEYYGK